MADLPPVVLRFAPTSASWLNLMSDGWPRDTLPTAAASGRSEQEAATLVTPRSNVCGPTSATGSTHKPPTPPFTLHKTAETFDFIAGYLQRLRESHH